MSILRYAAPVTRRLFGVALGATVLACGSAADDGARAPETAGSTSAPPANAATPAEPRADQAEAAAMVAMVIERAGDQLQAACGTAFDTCGATPGCNEILACAARSACSGAACYCADASCATPGPCRAVIDGAPGAHAPDGTSTSLGPASDAAAAVGACLQGVAGAAPGSVPQTPAPPEQAAPDAGDASDAGRDRRL